MTIPLENETGPLKQFKTKWKQPKFKTSLISIFCTVVILAAIVAGALWYTRPMSAEELCSGLDWSDPTDFSASYQVREVHPNGKVDTSFQSLNLEPDDPAIEEFIALLKSQTLHQKLSNLLPASNPDHYDWVACIVFPENTSLLLTCSDSTLSLQYQDRLTLCEAGDAFNQAVLDLFQLQTPR